ncbi:MAG: hypothetical protein K0R54_5599, partial [Clostridiaceae bacterium]|nr:hypothetical protein [Clostridiaceae bacterium]
SLVERGLSGQEAELYLNGQMTISEYVMKQEDNAFIIQAPCTLISYGTK